MTLRHLRIFIEVADTGSMTVTADRMYVAQPTISQSIAELEKHFGTKLFDRLSKKLYITETGRRLLDYARHITLLYDELEQTLVNPDMMGILKIGATLTVGASLMPRLVKGFSEKYPMTDIRVNISNTKEIEHMILKNDLDFAIIEGEVQSPDIVTFPILEDRLVMVCGDSHPLCGKGAVEAEDISNYGFLVRERGSGTRERFDNAMAIGGIKWKLAWESNATDAIVNAAVHGIGIGVISAMSVEGLLSSGDLKEVIIADINLYRQFCIIHHKNKYLTDSMKRFFESCHNLR